MNQDVKNVVANLQEALTHDLDNIFALGKLAGGECFGYCAHNERDLVTQICSISKLVTWLPSVLESALQTMADDGGFIVTADRKEQNEVIAGLRQISKAYLLVSISDNDKCFAQINGASRYVFTAFFSMLVADAPMRKMVTDALAMANDYLSSKEKT